jgi:hypothetical protein
MGGAGLKVGIGDSTADARSLRHWPVPHHTTASEARLGAGLMAESTRRSTETALRTDGRLTESQKQALLAVHSSYLAAKHSWDSEQYEQYEQYGGLTDCEAEAPAQRRQRLTRLLSSVDMRLGSCSGTKCVAGSSTYRLCGVCALAARIRSADVTESHVPAI